MTFAPRLISIALLFLSACGSDSNASNGGSVGAGSGGGSGTAGASGSASGGSSVGGAEAQGGGSNGGASGASGGAGPSSSGGGASTGGSSSHPDGGGLGGASSSPDGGTGDGAVPGTPGPCCDVTNAKGCTDKAVQDCVCKQDPRCCSEKWNDVCVALVGGLACGTSCAPGAGDCCTAHAAPGCSDAKVQACVCTTNQSPDCCNSAWDSFCVVLVTATVGGAAACGTCPP